MALYAIQPCKKCGADRWRLIGRVPNKRAVELTCIHCGTNIFVPPEGVIGEGSTAHE